MLHQNEMLQRICGEVLASTSSNVEMEPSKTEAKLYRNLCRCGFTSLAEGLRQGKLLLNNDGGQPGSCKMHPHKKNVENKPESDATLLTDTKPLASRSS